MHRQVMIHLSQPRNQPFAHSDRLHRARSGGGGRLRFRLQTRTHAARERVPGAGTTGVCVCVCVCVRGRECWVRLRYMDLVISEDVFFQS